MHNDGVDYGQCTLKDVCQSQQRVNPSLTLAHPMWRFILRDTLGKDLILHFFDSIFVISIYNNYISQE
jgi:hypothetical protein